ncbi:MAG: type II toxin-antitoxin system RelE/ParE family toxin [Candidatus Eremiobacteraeota bacterium]|nr:type II toxin-antitoxin system RelE/ParE family toxin [Candidatus Eremiobacteraeota bacterium]
MRIAYSPAARTDLARMRLDYEARAGLRIADELVGRIACTLQDVVGNHPTAGRARPELGHDIRSFPIVPYVAFYRIARSRVIVVRVLHGRRDIHPPIVSFLAAV